MKKLALIVTAVAAAGLTAPAFADPNPNSQTTGNPGNGNQVCLVDDEDIINEFGTGEFKNPGKTLQAFRQVRGENPKELIEDSVEYDNLGEAIDDNCGVAPS